MNKQSFIAKLRSTAFTLGISQKDLERVLLNAIVEAVFFAKVNELGFSGYLKGGSAQIWRLGLADFRPTRDVDVVTNLERQEVVQILTSLTGIQFGNFVIGKVAIQDDRTNWKVPSEYRLVVAKVPVLYEQSNWLTCDLEVLPFEVGNSFAMTSADESLGGVLARAGLADLIELPLISIELQIAEKLHALTEPGSVRAGDLFDLHLAVARLPIEVSTLADWVEKVYRRRAGHSFDSDWVPGDELRVRFDALNTGVDYDEAVGSLTRLLRNLGEHLGGLG